MLNLELKFIDVIHIDKLSDPNVLDAQHRQHKTKAKINIWIFVVQINRVSQICCPGHTVLILLMTIHYFAFLLQFNIQINCLILNIFNLRFYFGIYENQFYSMHTANKTHTRWHHIYHERNSTSYVYVDGYPVQSEFLFESGLCTLDMRSFIRSLGCDHADAYWIFNLEKFNFRIYLIQ